MAYDRDEKIKKALVNLEEALALYEQPRKSDLPFLTVCKTVEVLLEYLWETLKERVEADGLSAASPKEAVRQAAKIGLIAEPEDWIDVILARNDSVHDYSTIPEGEYVARAKRFVELAKALLRSLAQSGA